MAISVDPNLVGRAGDLAGPIHEREAGVAQTIASGGTVGAVGGAFFAESSNPVVTVNAVAPGPSPDLICLAILVNNTGRALGIPLAVLGALTPVALGVPAHSAIAVYADAL